MPTALSKRTDPHTRPTCTRTFDYIITLTFTSLTMMRVFITLTVCSATITRSSSGDEIANVNFLYDNIVHVLQNTVYSRIYSATGRRDYVVESRFTKFSEITQCNFHYAVQYAAEAISFLAICPAVCRLSIRPLSVDAT